MGFDSANDEEDRRKGPVDNREHEHEDGAPGRSAGDMTGDSQGLRDVAEKLESRGLSCRVVTFPGKSPSEELIEEVVVTNPAARERGQVRIGDDGAFTWEFSGDLDEAGAGRILDEVTNALPSTGVQLAQEQRHGADLIGTAEQQLVYLNTH